MIEYQVDLTKTAQTDILGIVRYIQTELQEPRIAGRLYRLLKEEINSLSYLPERNAVEDRGGIRELGLRRMVKNYSVFYLVNSDRKLVQVARVMYSGRDIGRQLADTDWDDL